MSVWSWKHQDGDSLESTNSTHIISGQFYSLCVFEGSAQTLACYVIIFNRREQHELVFWAFLLLFFRETFDIPVTVCDLLRAVAEVDVSNGLPTLKKFRCS